MADSCCKAETLGQEDPLEEEMAMNNLMDRGAWQATVMGCKESDMTESLSASTRTNTHTHTQGRNQHNIVKQLSTN